MEMLQFSSKNAAIGYLTDRFSDQDIDAIRCGYCDDIDQMHRYEEQAASAKGSTMFDMYVLIGGFKAMLGCNYDLITNEE